MPVAIPRREADRQSPIADDPARAAVVNVPSARRATPPERVGSWSDEQLALLVDATVDYAIFVLTPDGHVVTWNAGAERIKGYRAADIIGRHMSVFYTAEAIEAAHPSYELEVAERDGRYAEEGWRIRQDGSRFWASVTITALRDATGVLLGFGKLTHDLTDSRQIAADFAISLTQQQQVFETLAEGVVLCSVGSEREVAVVLANTAALDLLGHDQFALDAWISGHGPSGVILDADGEVLVRRDLPFAVTARTGQGVDGFTWSWTHPSGRITWLESHSRPVFDASGVLTGVVFSLVDITDRHLTRTQHEWSRARFTALVEHSSDVVLILDANAVVRYASPAYFAAYGERPEDRIDLSLSERVHPGDWARFLTALDQVMITPHELVTVECRITRPDEGDRYLEMTLGNRCSDLAVAGIVVNCRDVTDRVITAELLAHDAMHDKLTGLPNRALLLDRLAQLLGREERQQCQSALLFIDLDHFKRINDSLGHSAGDAVLKVIARRLERVLRPGDTVARFGGDEFVLLAERTPSTQAARLIAERVRRTVKEPIKLDSRAVTLDCSIGISLGANGSADELLQRADTALYSAKGHGRGRSELYDRAMRLGAQRRLDVEALIRQAVQDDAIIVHYQPIVLLATGEQIAFEALARLTDPGGLLMPPADFISVAEDSGLILPLGLEVLRKACMTQSHWALQGHETLSVAVNLAAQQLRSPDLVGEIAGVLSASGLPGSALCLELTESSLIEADASTRRTVQRLSDLGIALALDDFGTGWSSLAHLRGFPIDVVKIDRSFVAGVGSSHSDTELVKAIIGLGEALGVRTVAEGVETPEQAEILRGFGCKEAQGFLYGRPTLLPALASVTNPASEKNRCAPIARVNGGSPWT